MRLGKVDWTIDQYEAALTQALHHLIWVWYQYGNGETLSEVRKRSPLVPRDCVNGDVILSHRCVSAGEEAGQFLEFLGLAENKFPYVRLTVAGIDLMDLTDDQLQ